jgi:predicted DNA-binding mobile mystery protein A
MRRHLALRRSHLEQQLDVLRKGLEIPAPRKGWVHEVRVALGMTLRQFAARTGSTAPQNVSALERSEAEGKISLNSLRTAAHGLGCELVYAIVPRTSLEQMVRERIEQVAMERIRRVSHTMALESQSVTSPYIEKQRQQLVADMMAKQPRDLWEFPDTR